MIRQNTVPSPFLKRTLIECIQPLFVKMEFMGLLKCHNANCAIGIMALWHYGIWELEV